MVEDNNEEKQTELIEPNPIKIGSRVLDDNSLTVLLPKYEDIFRQIKTIRESAKSTKDKSKDTKEFFEKEPEFKKHHNNVISILGERGSGKTSVLLTIKYKFMEFQKRTAKEQSKNSITDNILKSDSMLPIIVPQDMEESSDSMAWIIGFFRDIVKEINEEYKKNHHKYYQEVDKNCIYGMKFDENPVSRAFDDLIRAYILRKPEYKEKILTEKYTTNFDYIKSNEETFNLDVQLVEKFQKFIDEYLKFKKRESDREDKEPLIYVFFDDVDISTKKCIDVLETIMRYLSHPNIVVFIAGNYKNFVETLTLEYLRNDGLLENQKMMVDYVGDYVGEYVEERNVGLIDGDYDNIFQTKNNALKVRKDLSYDYLKKVLSPTLRYELPKLENKNKAEFRYFDGVRLQEKDNTEGLKMIELIEKTFNMSKSESFLRFKSENEVIYEYFDFLDTHPRGLMNVYYYLNSKLGEDSKSIDALFLKQFLEVLINSNMELTRSRKDIEERIQIEENDDRNVIIILNYEGYEKLSLSTVYLMKFFEKIGTLEANKFD